jgi:hypothetical protein
MEPKTIFVIVKLTIDPRANPDEVVTEMDCDFVHSDIIDHEVRDMVDQYEDLEMSEEDEKGDDDVCENGMFVSM